MPVYTFRDTSTGEVFEKIMSYDDRVEFLEHNTNVAPITVAPAIIGGRSMDSGRLPEGFKDKLRLMKEKNPKARGVDHLI